MQPEKKRRHSREQIFTSLCSTLDCNDKKWTTGNFANFLFWLGQNNYPKPMKLSVASCLEGKILVANFESIADGVSNIYTFIKKPALPHNGQAVCTSSQGNCSAK